MGFIITLLYILTVLSAILLVCVVLLQKGKDGGVVAMGAGVGEALFGAQVGSFLIKTTIVLGSIFLLSALTISILASRGYVGSSIMDGAPAPQSAPAAPADYPAE